MQKPQIDWGRGVTNIRPKHSKSATNKGNVDGT